MTETLIAAALLTSSATNGESARPAAFGEERASRPVRAGRPAGGGGVYYAGCNEVRALGKAPLYAGQPGYRIEMDGDRDGIACEPRRGRRR